MQRCFSSKADGTRRWVCAVAKQAGDPVFAATLNVEGAMDVEVTADAAHSTLARIVQLVREG